MNEIAKTMVKTRDAVLSKIYGLGLKREEEAKAYVRRLSSSFKLPKELPSIEEQLKKLTAALSVLETPGLDQAETLRLRSIISGVKIYKELFADYLNYRELEERLVELEGKYRELSKNKTS